jgi:adenylylsulfate kinase
MSLPIAAPPLPEASAWLRDLHAAVSADVGLYAQCASRWPRTAVPVLWITGLAGSGKTSLATRLIERLAAERQHALLLDGDRVRELFDDHDQLQRHDSASRQRRAWRISQLAHRAAYEGQPVVVATISLLHAVQQANRLCHARFAEVLLQPSMRQLALRRPDLYSEVAEGDEVMGVGQTPQWPKAADLHLTDDGDDPQQLRALAASLRLWKRLGCPQAEALRP